jgi:hypothetical protein
VFQKSDPHENENHSAFPRPGIVFRVSSSDGYLPHLTARVSTTSVLCDGVKDSRAGFTLLKEPTINLNAMFRAQTEDDGTFLFHPDHLDRGLDYLYVDKPELLSKDQERINHKRSQ